MGQYYDDETQTYYNYFRDYQPSLGRYIQADPIGLNGGLNTYIYANDNPINYLDPDGHLPILVVMMIAGGVTNGFWSAMGEVANRCRDVGDIATAFAKGFASGAIGTAAGVLSGNAFLAGAAAGIVGTVVDSTLNKEMPSVNNMAANMVIGAISGGLAGSAFKLKGGRGMVPFLTTPRNSKNWGRNADRLVGAGWCGCNGKYDRWGYSSC